MKFPRTKIPFSRNKELNPVKEAEFPFHEIPFTQDEIYSSNPEHDADTAENLIKQNRLKELRDLIDKRNIVDDLTYPDAGISTRSFLDNILDKQLHKQNPELKDLNTLDLANALKKKYYPNLDELSNKAGISSKISVNPREGDNYDVSEGININPYNQGQAGTAMHELGHQLDRAYRNIRNSRENMFTGEEYPEVIKLFDKINKENPEYKEVLDKDQRLTNNEGGEQNHPIPNFSDYDWKEGDFKSSFMTNPSDLQDMVAKKHHTGRNYPFDNLVNLIQKKKVF